METPNDLHDNFKARIDELHSAIMVWLKQLKAQKKMLDDLGTANETENLPLLGKALDTLDTDLLDRAGLAEQAGALAEQARLRLDTLRSDQRQALGRDLKAACAEANRSFRMLTENPPEFMVAPFTVKVDIERMEASLRYSRQELRRMPARATEILSAAQKAAEELSSRQESTEDFFDLLVAAYRAVLGNKGRSFGERVELADVLPQVALLRQGGRFFENPLRESFSSYSKACFLYDLARVRAARLLERDGVRLDLGTATGNSVKKKSRVFFLNGPDGQGQYYLSLRFVPVQR
jgi:hypothetical protein